MSETFAYDVFLSHSAKDEPAVRKLAERLKADGLRVCPLSFRESAADGPLSLRERARVRADELEQALESSRVLVLCMSRHALASEWTMLESGTFRFRDPTNRLRRFIPLRLDDAEPPEPLKPFACVDWRGESADEYARLLLACRPPAPEPKPAGSEGLCKRVFSLAHTGFVVSVAMSADGRLAVSGSWDKTVRLWEVSSERCLGTLEGHTNGVLSVALSADGRLALSGSLDKTVRVWEVATGRCLGTLEGHSADVSCVALSADGRLALSGSKDNTVRVWEVSTGRCLGTLEGHTATVSSVALGGDGRLAISGSLDKTVRVWEVSSGRCLGTLEGHTKGVLSVALSADGRLALSGSNDKTVRVWEVASGRCLGTLEGHSADVNCVALSADGRLALSGSNDKTVRVWEISSGRCLATLEGHTGPMYGRTPEVHSVALGGDGRLALSADWDGEVGVWDLSGFAEPPAEGVAGAAAAERYTNAKVLLVGESGVGKTGLAWRLTEDRFVPSISTDGVESKRTDWAEQLALPQVGHAEGTEREIWLWDFAGQADYRLIHQLFMDETALAVLVFNPQSENPFDGLGQWDRDLQRAARRKYAKLLVAARCDRGGLMVSHESVEAFRTDRGFAVFLQTSAQTGKGCKELRDAIVQHVPWDDIPWTASPRVFRLLKDEIVRLKEEGQVLLRMGELKQQLEFRLPGERFSLQELRAVVGLLAGPGVVWQLEFGDFVLLQPERINAYAGAVIRSVRAHTEEIGCIAEQKVLDGDLDYQDMKRLPRPEEEIVLRAMHQTFVDHGLCLREHTEQGTFLIFPSYFKRERPELTGHPLVLVTYQFNGPLEEIYATLVVRLHHTAAFERDNLWRFAADFRTPARKRLGLKMTKKAEGAAEMEVYFEPGIADDLQVTFIRYVHEHLKVKAQDVQRLRHYVCPHCRTPVEGRRAIQTRLDKGLKDILCLTCEKRVLLWDLIEEKFASEEFHRRARELEELAKAAIDNESRELILVGHAYAIAGEAGQIYRQYTNSDHGIDGEIEFKDSLGKASGKRLYLQLKSGDSYLYHRERDGAEVFQIKNPRHAEYWQQQAYPVMLVIRTSDGSIRWMDVSAHLKRESQGGKKAVKQIVFEGEPLTALSVRTMRDKALPWPQ